MMVLWYFLSGLFMMMSTTHCIHHGFNTSSQPAIFSWKSFDYSPVTVCYCLCFTGSLSGRSASMWCSIQSIDLPNTHAGHSFGAAGTACCVIGSGSSGFVRSKRYSVDCASLDSEARSTTMSSYATGTGKRACFIVRVTKTSCGLSKSMSACWPQV